MALNSTAHSLGQGGILTTWTPELVANAPDPTRAFAFYVQQVLGVPLATAKDLVVLRQRINDVFDRCPQATYYTLCRVVGWARRKRIRRARVYLVVDLLPEAWADRALPELDEPVVDKKVEQRIADALTVETDPSWRRRLIGAMGTSARSRVLNDWMLSRA